MFFKETVSNERTVKTEQENVSYLSKHMPPKLKLQVGQPWSSLSGITGGGGGGWIYSGASPQIKNNNPHHLKILHGFVLGVFPVSQATSARQKRSDVFVFIESNTARDQFFMIKWNEKNPKLPFAVIKIQRQLCVR